MLNADSVRKIRLETPHFILRTIEPDDASVEWTQWRKDPTAARMLNAPQRDVSTEEIRDYIAGFDGHASHLLGIFDKLDGKLIGIRAIYVDWQRKEFVVNVLVGETAARGKGARTETRDVIYNYLFEELGLETARCTILAHNTDVLRIMDENGWQHIDTSYKPSVSGGAPVELRHFSLSREENRRGEQARALRNAAKAGAHTTRR